MYKLMVKVLLLLAFSSFSFSNGIDVSAGIGDNGTKIRAKSSFDISNNKDFLNILYERGFGIASQHYGFGIGIKKNNLELDTYYRMESGHSLLNGVDAKISKTILKYKAYELKGFEFKLQGSYETALTDGLDVTNGIVGISLSKAFIKNLYFEVLYGIDVNYPSNIDIGLMLGYGFKNLW